MNLFTKKKKKEKLNIPVLKSPSSILAPEISYPLSFPQALASSGYALSYFSS